MNSALLGVLLLAQAPRVTTTAGAAAATVTTTAPVAAPTATAEATETPATPAETPAPATEGTPRPAGLGVPVIFRGVCDPRAGCTITAAGMVNAAKLVPIACDASNEKEVREKIGARYLAPGTTLDLYARGSAVGSFEVTGAIAGKGCVVRATGRKRNTPVTILNFIALLPDDPVRLAALKFPSAAEPDARSIAALALKEANESTVGLSLNQSRRFREGNVSVMVVDADAGSRHVVAIAEGSGRDPAAWKIAWSSVAPSSDAHFVLADAFDLGADGHGEVLLEREPAEWVLLRRNGGTWK
ncbi:MAG TPA: hypothetical protein VMV18_06320 [bacterium]|nr:hypothetical protein [bacterium]